MYSYIRGSVEEISKDYIVLEQGGIGYHILVPSSFSYMLHLHDQDVLVYTYFQASENGVFLYGFPDRETKHIFELLLTVNGIGPKSAIAILSTLSVDDLRFAILSGDEKAISKAPTIGGKTAQRIILDLKDKIDLSTAFEDKLKRGEPTSNSLKSEAIEALTSLGYSPSEALKAMQEIDITDDMTVEELLKLSLSRLTFL